MADAIVSVHFKDMSVSEEVRELITDRCLALAAEFPEITHMDVTLTPDGGGHVATGRVTGKSTELATHANGSQPGHAGDRLLDKLRIQLRRNHDKRIFAHRREAQRNHARRG